jgi:hypothetical protein
VQTRALGSTVEGMVPKRLLTPADRSVAIRIALAGLATGEPSEEILSKLGALRVRHDTFPAEELLELAADAIHESGTTPADPIDCERIRERFLPDHRFSGKTQHYKSKYAISAAAMIHGGVYPDLLDDAAWWEADDRWTYSYFAFLLFMRAAAERRGTSVEKVATRSPISVE